MGELRLDWDRLFEHVKWVTHSLSFSLTKDYSCNKKASTCEGQNKHYAYVLPDYKLLVSNHRRKLLLLVFSKFLLRRIVIPVVVFLFKAILLIFFTCIFKIIFLILWLSWFPSWVTSARLQILSSYLLGIWIFINAIYLVTCLHLRFIRRMHLLFYIFILIFLNNCISPTFFLLTWWVAITIILLPS